MAIFQDELVPALSEWISQQQMFWVASSPLSADGHINISPKGIAGTFHVVNSRRVWYEDLSGTGAETVAHIRENGRVTILFQAFEGPARIVRLYGKGFIYEIGSPEYEMLLPPGKRIPGSRAIIGLDIFKVATTCGYAVPFYQFLGHRTRLIDWAAKKETVDIREEKALHPSTIIGIDSCTQPDGEVSTLNPEGMRAWWQNRNLTSLDGLPAFSVNIGIRFPFSTLLNPMHHRAQLFPNNIPSETKNANSHLTSSVGYQDAGMKNHQSAIELESLRAQCQHIISQLSTIVLLVLAFILGIAVDRLFTNQYASAPYPLVVSSRNPF